VRDRSLSAKVPIVNSERHEGRHWLFLAGAIPSARATERMLRARNDSERSRVRRSKVLISAGDLSKSRHVKERRKVCHASEEKSRGGGGTPSRQQRFSLQNAFFADLHGPFESGMLAIKQIPRERVIAESESSRAT